MGGTSYLINAEFLVLCVLSITYCGQSITSMCSQNYTLVLLSFAKDMLCTIHSAGFALLSLQEIFDRILYLCSYLDIPLFVFK